jgi:hypothetical protein
MYHHVLGAPVLDPTEHSHSLVISTIIFIVGITLILVNRVRHRWCPVFSSRIESEEVLASVVLVVCTPWKTGGSVHSTRSAKAFLVVRVEFYLIAN